LIAIKPKRDKHKNSTVLVLPFPALNSFHKLD
jgi:hypothetical protein